MQPSPKEHDTLLQDLSNTMLDVCRESVTLIKRNDQASSITLTQQQEWDVYLELLKVMFNLADRVSAFYIPIQQQPEFMDRLEDHASERLKTLLAPSLSASQIDDQEIVLSVGQAVADSRQTYERHKFVFSENSQERTAFFQHASERVAGRANAGDNQAVTATAMLCISAVLPALTALFEGKTPAPDTTASPATDTGGKAQSSEAASPGRQAIKLISVVSAIKGMDGEFETRWGLLPQFRRDLKPDQIEALTRHMSRVAQIVGDRFAIASSKFLGQSNPPTGTA
ncbi:MAG: hypothetical protein OXU40_02935 [Nitrospira sp.]|nr:hypothetical protein [Nitrospira sp.]